MKILQIKIDGFGRWINADINVATPLQIFYGPNEAGKSTLVEFIKGVLFGWKNGQGKNKYKQYYPKQTDTYGGSLLVEQDGKRYWVHRSGKRRGGKVEITKEDGSRTHMTLEELVGPLTRRLVEDIFVFNQSELSQVDDLSADELRQDLQQVGAVGSLHWQEVRRELAKTAAGMYKPRGRKPVLNQAFKKVQELSEQLTAAQSKSDQYQKLQEQLMLTTTRQQSLQEELQRARKRQENLLNQQRLWPLYEQWQAVQDHQRSVIKISDEDLTKVQRLQAALPEAKHQVEAAATELAATQQQIQQLTSPELMAFQQQWHGYSNPEHQIEDLRVQQLTHDRQKERAEGARQDLSTIQQRLGGNNLPKPLSASQREELTRLLQPVSQDHQPQRQLKPAIISGIAGLLVLVAGLTMKTVVLDIAGVVLLVVAAWLTYQQNQQASRWQQQFEAAKRQHQQALTRFGQEHGLTKFDPQRWLTIQADLEKAQTLQATVNQFDDEEAQLSSQLKKWQASFAHLHATTPADFWTQLLTYLSDSEEQLKQLTSLQQQLARQKQRWQELQKKCDQQQAALTSIYRQVGASDEEEFRDYLQRRTQLQNEKATKSATEAQLKPQVREQLARYANKAELDQQVAAGQVEVAHLQDQQTQQTSTAEQLRIQKAALVKDGTVTRLEQELANAETAATRLAQQWFATTFASRWIGKSLELASATRYPQIVERATEYFATLTDNRYQTINFVDGQLEVAGPAGRRFEVGELSTGTAEQLYVALRLGFVSVMSDTVQFPLVVDDGFVNFDNDRKSRVLDLLAQLAKTNQVIYFTADNRVLLNQDLVVTELGRSESND